MALLQISGLISVSHPKGTNVTAPEISSCLMCSRGVAAALTKCSRTPGCVTCGMADVAFTMKQYVQTGLEAGRRSPPPWQS
jgi:hypothetical protein